MMGMFRQITLDGSIRQSKLHSCVGKARQTASSECSCPYLSFLVMVFVAVGDGVDTERDWCSMGVCAGALPMGAHHPSSLAQIGVFLEASQAG